MIVYMLKDGLGNQLFEYSYAKKIQEMSGDKKIILCTFLYKLPNFSLGGTRNVSLHHFNLPNDVVIASGITNYFYFIYFMFRLLIVYKKDFISWFLKGKRVSRGDNYYSDCRHGLYISEGAFAVPGYIHSSKKVKFIMGNYEGVEAFPRDIVSHKNSLQIVSPPSSDNIEMLQKIQDSQSVCVHVRRGDYNKKGNEYLQVCDKEYYVNAMQYIKNHRRNPVFYIFSNSHDDLEWIKENYGFNGDVIYVDLDNRDYEELRLMIACKDFIISNSTFSWWSSYLSSNNNKIVIAPEKWTKDSAAEGLYREEFVCM